MTRVGTWYIATQQPLTRLGQNKESMGPVVQKLIGFRRHEIIRHLQRLSAQDRRLRFGVCLTDAAIERYVNGIKFTHDKVFGVFESDLTLSGVAHLALDLERETAELGLSVVPELRGKGYGFALLSRAKLYASAVSYKKLYLHCFAENQVIIHLARKAGMTVVTARGEADAHVVLDEGRSADLASEAMHDQIALVDYLFKRQARWLTRARV
jgi:RimJ/RimL family protein N-acetyltransferase